MGPEAHRVCGVVVVVSPLDQTKWQRIRKQILAERPFCKSCAAEGRLTFSTEIRLINPALGFNDRRNIEVLCAGCFRSAEVKACL
jgi:hypothetical protein